MKRVVLILLIAVVLVSALALPVLAAPDGGISSSVQKATAESFKADVDAIASRIVSFIRSIAGIAAVIFLLWAGFTFWTAGGSSQKLSEAKSQLIYFLIAMFFVMAAEKIVGLIFSLFGWQI